MHHHSTYTITLNGTEEEVAAMMEFLSGTFPDSVLNRPAEISITDNYDIVYLEDIQELAKKMTAKAETLDFVIRGTVDTSESAGEFMDFEIRCKSGILTSRDSGWYVELDASVYEDYEEFCDAYDIEDDEHRFTEEEYNAMCTGVWYILDSGDGEAVPEVPLGAEERLSIQ